MPTLLAELDQLEATPVEIALENPEDTLDLEALQLIGGISLNITNMQLPCCGDCMGCEPADCTACHG